MKIEMDSRVGFGATSVLEQEVLAYLKTEHKAGRDIRENKYLIVYNQLHNYNQGGLKEELYEEAESA